MAIRSCGKTVRNSASLSAATAWASIRTRSSRLDVGTATGDITMPRGTEAVDTVFAVGGCDPTEESSRRIQFSPDGQFQDCELSCMHSKREEKGRPSAQPPLAGVPLLADSHNRSKLTIQGVDWS